MAIGPIDYVSGLLPTNDSIAQSIGQGMQLRAAYDQQQQLKQQQAAALAAQQKYEQDKAAALANPTPQAFAALAVNYPQHREAFKQGWDQLSSAQQQGELRDTSTIAAALQSNRPDVALAKIDERIGAMKNSGQDTTVLTFLRGQIEQDPRKAHGDVLNVLAGLPGGDKVLENLGKIGTEARAQEMQAPTLANAQSTAQKSAIEAKYAEQNAVKDLEKKGWDIKKITADIEIAREANRIAKMNAETSRTTNDLRRQELELKVKEARSALDEKIRTKVADAESSATNIDNSLNTIRRIKNSQGLRDVIGSFEGNRFYPNQLVASTVGLVNPFSSGGDDRADAIALIDTLGSQAFLSQAANLKGMGALSNAEGEKLQSALTNLSRQQSEKQFIANLDEAERLLQKGRENISKRTGVPLPPPDIPARTPLPSGAAPAAPGASLLPSSQATPGRPPLDSFFTPAGS